MDPNRFDDLMRSLRPPRSRRSVVAALLVGLLGPVMAGAADGKRGRGKGTGKKANLEIKVFGGGKINSALDDVGAKNIEFVRQFLSDEGYVAMSEDLGGTYARRVLFKPHSGRAFVKRLDSDVGDNVAREEAAIAKRRIVLPTPADDIELF